MHSVAQVTLLVPSLQLIKTHTFTHSYIFTIKEIVENLHFCKANLLRACDSDR